MTSAANDKAEGQVALFTKLDVVKHAVNAVVESLGPHDRVGVAWFSDEAGVAAPMTECDADGKASLRSAVALMTTIGGTNIWSGIDAALTLSRNAAEAVVDADDNKCRRYDILLLTDGVSTQKPAKGEVAALEAAMARAREDGPSSAAWADRVTLTTLGFGYYLDSELLAKLATAGRGAYAFIPDGQMVGTVVVNALAAASVAVAGPLRLRLRPSSPRCKVRVLGDGERDQARAGGEVVAWVGDVRRGQTRSVLVELELEGATNGAKDDDEDILPTASLLLPGGKEVPLSALPAIEANMPEPKGSSSIAERIAVQRARAAFLTRVPLALRRAKLDLQGACNAMSALMDEIEALCPSAPVLLDLQGQVSEALSQKAYLERWGWHFLPSLLAAHADERCNNFKDPGVQAYASEQFDQARDALDAVFNNLQPPVPSIRPHDGTCAMAVSAQRFSASFNNHYNGCFAPETPVFMADGTEKRIDELAKGDLVFAPDATSRAAEVLVVTRHSVPAGEKGHALCSLPAGGGASSPPLRITPWHPVRRGGTWAFPATLAPSTDADGVQTVYNLALAGDVAEHGGVFVAAGVHAVPLGHGLRDDVARHPYFGTAAVLDDLAQLPGFEDGAVEVPASAVRRSPVTGRIDALRLAQPATATIGTQVAVLIPKLLIPFAFLVLRSTTTEYPNRAEETLKP